MKSVEIIYRYGAEGEVVRPRPVDSDAARHRLDEGSRAFAALIESLADDNGKASRVIQVDPQDLGLVTGDTAGPKQRPYAAVLGCSDARVPIELIFNEGPNDLFVIRVAGNGLGNEVLGSLKYAVEHLGDSLKVVAVWATAAAVRYRQRSTYFSNRHDTCRSPPAMRCAASSTACL